MPTEDEYRDVFEDFTDSESQVDFEGFMTLYEEAGAPDDIDTWFEFLNTFYPDVDEYGDIRSHDREFWEDLREQFYEYSGMTGENIDWELWRSIIESISGGG